MADVSESGELSPPSEFVAGASPASITSWAVVATLLVAAAGVAVLGGVVSGALLESSNAITTAQRIQAIARGADMSTSVVLLIAVFIAVDRGVARLGLMTATMAVAVAISLLATVQVITALVAPEFRHAIGTGALLGVLGAPLATAVVGAATAVVAAIVGRR